MYKNITLLSLLGCIKATLALCQISQAPNINFSCSFNNTPCFVSTTLNLYCSENTVFSASLSSGANASFSPRTMTTAAGNKLNYNIYLDANQQKIFGDATQGTYTLDTSCSGTCAYPLFAYSFGATNLKAGHYTDSLILTINY